MKNILIVEDEDYIRNNLIVTAKTINPKINVYSTNSAEEALQIAKSTVITGFFIDIQLIDYSGFELAKQLRTMETYFFTPIVFITAIPTRELMAFREIHCYDYIIKPFSQEEIEKVFKKILIDYVACMGEQGKENKMIQLKFKDHSQLVAVENISYIEYANRKIVINTTKEVIEYIHMPLKTFIKNLSEEFVQVHQSIVINKKYIETIDFGNRCIKLKGVDKDIPIGRTYKKQVGEIVNGLI